MGAFIQLWYVRLVLLLCQGRLYKLENTQRDCIVSIGGGSLVQGMLPTDDALPSDRCECVT